MKLIDQLATLYPDSSRRTLKSWIKWGRVRIDGSRVKDFDLEEGQKVELQKKENFVLYADRHLIAIEKPHGLLSVPDESGRTSALEILRQQYRTVYPVHRLDQGASGVLLFARSLDAKRRLSEMFRDHDLEREYVAIVEGRIAQKSGTWSFPLLELESYDVIVSDEGRDAITHFELMRFSAKFSYLRIKLETGRKHQIRVHCKEVGHPIIGDKRYGSTLDPIRRLGLHACSLKFEHPITAKRMEFEAELPNFFKTPH